MAGVDNNCVSSAEAPASFAETDNLHRNDDSQVAEQPLSAVRQEVIDEAADALEETKEPDLTELGRDMFSKAAIYLRGDLAATADDYRLLEKMNRVTSLKYSQMKDLGMDINRALSDLNEKYRNLQPFLDQIDQVEESVGNLEQAAHRLDAYSRRLELKFKQLEKR